MSERHPPVMPSSEDEVWEMRVEELARHMPYPPTPDIAGPVRARLGRAGFRALPVALRAAALAGIVLLLAMLLVPDLRSRALEFLQIGAVRFVEQPTETPTRAETLSPALTPGVLPSVLALPGETSLDAARDAVALPVRLPAYPPDLGPPDRVFVSDDKIESVVLVWLRTDDPGAVRFSLHTLGASTFALKIAAPTEETSVAGQQAVWATKPHEYWIPTASGEPLRLLVTTPVLVWERDGVTYRLEGELTLDEARRIAESLE